MTDRDEQRRLRWAGIAGVLGAVGWIIGDVLMVGHRADYAAYPLLFETYARQLDAGLVEHLVGVTHERLIAGALFAVFTIPLYLVGGWHLWRGMRSAGPRWAVPAAVLIFIGYAFGAAELRLGGGHGKDGEVVRIERTDDVKGAARTARGSRS